MSANKLRYEKLTKELQKNYEKHTIDLRVTRELQRVYKSLRNYSKLSRNIFVSAFYEVL